MIAHRVEAGYSSSANYVWHSRWPASSSYRHSRCLMSLQASLSLVLVTNNMGGVRAGACAGSRELGSCGAVMSIVVFEMFVRKSCYKPTHRHTPWPMEKRIEGQTRWKPATQSHRTKAPAIGATSAGPL